jgi:glycogen operon protein
MGLSRLFWIPDGGAGADGAYVTYPFADLVGQVALESTRARCMVVGEDLGTVPDGFRDVMTEANILSYRVLLLEREGRRFRPAASYPARAVACVTTHDLPPLAGWWEGADLQERSALGLLPIDVDADETREAERVALTEALVEEGCLAPPETGPPPIEAIIEGVHEFIASTPADLMLIQVEELADMRVGVNLPGTNTERPNWRLRVPVPVETLLTSPEARKILKSVRARNRGTADNP